MIVFVTGATGFLGAHLLASCLLKGYEVVALRRATSSLSQLEFIFRFYGLNYKDYTSIIRWVECDMSDFEALSNAMKGCDSVVHCAADVGLGGVDAQMMYDTNVELTNIVLRSAKQAGVAKFCYISSIAALGSNSSVVTEQTSWDSRAKHSVYASSKHQAMINVVNASSLEFSTVALCPGPILGVSAKNQSSAQIIYLAKRGVPFAVNGGSGYVDVRDVCTAIISVLNSPIIKRKYYILVGYNISNVQLLRALSRGFKRISPIVLPKSIVYLVAYIAEFLFYLVGKKPQLNRTMARTITHRTYYSGTLAEQELAVKYTKFEDTIDDICNYMK